jgi:MHS family proline/betaine transporter-like MFS transporter
MTTAGSETSLLALSPAQRRSATLAAVVGNALEWFDFSVYGYLATPIGHTFFPADSPSMQVVAAFGVFAVGYLMRPIGSLVLGPIGDLLGRRLMLRLSILVMGAACLAIALLPGHDRWGSAAGTTLVLLRMLQGFSVGGEFTGSITYTSEAATAGRRGLASSSTSAGSLLGFTAGTLVVALLAWLLGGEALEGWGWRIPFALGAAVALLGLWLRRDMPETLSPESVVGPGAGGLRALLAAIGDQLHALSRHWRLVLWISALVSFANVVFYVMFVYFVDHAGHGGGGTAVGPASTITTVVQACGIPLVLLGGLLTDRLGPWPVNWWANLLLLLLAPLALPLAQAGGVVGLALGQALVVGPVMVLLGSQGLLAVQQVPARLRCTVFSVAYSLAMALFAGTGPLVCSWLLEQRGLVWGPTVYCLMFATPALLALRQIRPSLQRGR